MTEAPTGVAHDATREHQPERRQTVGADDARLNRRPTGLIYSGLP